MLAACSSDSPAPSSTESAPVVEAPTAHPPNPLAFSAPTLDGGRFDLAERNRPTGRRVVVFLFDPSSSYPQHPTPDTRHPSSAAAILAAERLYQQRHAYNLEVVGIAVPPGYRPGRPMTNDGMTNDEWGPGKQDGPTRHSAFVIDSSFVIRHSSLAHLVRKRLADLGATFPCVVDPDGTLVERYRLAWGLHKLEALPAFYAFEAGSNEPAGRPIFAEAAAHSAEAADYLLRRVLKQFGLEVAVDVDPLAGDRPLVPDVVLTDSQGTPHRLRDYAGRLLLLVFIVRDCPRCKEQLEFLTHQLATLGDEGAGQSKITLLVVCADLSGEPLAKLIADRGYTFPVGPDPDWTLRSAFRYRGATPDTFVIAPDGRISFRHRGYSADLRSILHMEIRTLLGLPTRPLLSVESYAGDHACRICHPAQYADWTLTRHACAWETLVRLGRENDPQCVSCHVTGMQSAVGRPQSAGSGNRQSAIGNRQFARGFVSYAKTPHLAGVQCESCHGQNGCAAFARAKAAMPNARFQMPNSSTGDGKLKIGNPAPSPASPPFIPSSSDPEHRKPNTDNRVLASRCAGCHDAVHSPRFDFASYRAKALHNRAAELAGLPRVEREARLRRLCSGVRDDLFSPDAPYVGSAVCGRCHKTEYEALQDGPHTRALAALAQAAPDTPSTPRHIRGIVGLSRADCLRCHTTGYGRPGGFPAEPEEKSFTTDYTDDTDEHRQENFWVSNPGPFFSHPCDPCNPWSNLFSKRTGVFSSAHSSWVPGGGPGGEKAPVLFSAALPLTPNTASEGVGCEACHGPGKAHADDPQRPRAILRLGGTCPECNVLSICRQCHDDANSPDFDYRRDLPKARHPVGTARRGGSRTAPTAAQEPCRTTDATHTGDDAVWPFRRPQVRMSLDERLARYVEQELAVRLGLGSRLTGVPVERLAAGKVEHLRRVDVPGFGRVILRAFYRKAHRRRPAGRARLTELLTQGGIRVPRVLFVDDSARTRRDCGFAILAEEFLDGLPPTGLPPERHAGVLDAATDILLRLHAIRSRTAGKPWEGDGWRPADRARTLLAAWLRPLAALPVGLEPGQAGRLEAWVPPALDALQAPPYPLVHGDIHSGNLLLGAGGELCLLDLGAMAFGIPHLDLFLAETALCRGDAGLRQRLLERYFAANSGFTLRAYEAGRALVAAWHALGKAGVAARRALKKEARGQPASALREKSAHFWSLARQSLAEAGAPQVRSGE